MNPGITYVSTGKAADLLGVSTATVLALMDDGTLDGYTLPSGHRRIRLSSVDVLVNGATPTPGDGARLAAQAGRAARDAGGAA